MNDLRLFTVGVDGLKPSYTRDRVQLTLGERN